MATTYVKPEEFMLRFDSRLVAQYCADSDDGEPGDPFNSAILNAALFDASARVDAAVLKGKRYSRVQLEEMAGLRPPLYIPGPQYALLARIVSCLAMGYLMQRRLSEIESIGALVPGYNDALQMLQNLQDGQYVFDVGATLDATLPEAVGVPSTDANRPTYWNPMFGQFNKPTW